MENGKSTFKHWCIVELFGHSKIAGYCTEENIAGTNMLRVDVPETKTQPAFTKYYGSSAIYAINPVDEKTAVIAVENLKIGQVVEWNAETFINKFNENKPALPAATGPEMEEEVEDYMTTDRSEGGY